MTQFDIHNQDQFLRLFLANEEALRFFIRSLVPDRESCREITQETAAVLWRKFDPTMSDDDFKRWAFGVARMEVLTFRRDKARDRHVFSDDLAQLFEEELSLRQPQQSLQAEALEQCIALLSERQRQLIDATYHAGKKINQVADEIGATPMSLYKKLHRVRMQLMECMNKRLNLNT